MALPRPEHLPPRRPNGLLRGLIRAYSGLVLRKVDFSCDLEDLDGLGPGPYLILMNHSSFIDLEIAAAVLARFPYAIVCTTDAFVGKEKLLRSIGCFPTVKFAADMTLLADMRSALRDAGCSVLMFPEAGYSFDGRATTLPRRLGILLKKLDVPVVGVLTQGAFAHDPLYNCLQTRRVPVSARVRGLLTREEIREKSVEQLDAVIDGLFSFDGFAWQADNGIRIAEPFRADGLHRVLYKCPRCGGEGTTLGQGTALICRRCGARYELTELGRMAAAEGETEFPHIPDWYAWERDCVRRELKSGAYRLNVPVDIGMLVDYKALYRVGEGRLLHDAGGFTLAGCGGALHFRLPARRTYTVNADFFWYELGDVIAIGDTDVQYYCFPREDIPVAKVRLAAEELYKLSRPQRVRA